MLTSDILTVKHIIIPTLKTNITAGRADSFMPRIDIAPKTWANEAIALNITKRAAQIDSKSIETKINATIIQHTKMSANDERKVIYCSQKIKGIPRITDKYINDKSILIIFLR